MNTRNTLLVKDLLLGSRHTVKFKNIKCIQSEDFYDDDIYYVYNFPEKSGKVPKNGYWRMNKNDNINPKRIARFPSTYRVRLREYDKNNRDDSFDVVSFRKYPDDIGGPFFRLPATEPQNFTPTVLQRYGYGRGKYVLSFRVLPPGFQFLSNIRDAVLFLSPLYENANFKDIGEAYESFNKDNYREIYAAILSALNSDLSNDPLEAAAYFSYVNACRLQLVEADSIHTQQPTEVAKYNKIEHIHQGIASEIEIIEEILKWGIDDDILE